MDHYERARQQFGSFLFSRGLCAGRSCRASRRHESGSPIKSSIRMVDIGGFLGVTMGGWGAVGTTRFLQGDVISIRQDAADLVSGRSDREAAALPDGIGVGRMLGGRRFVTLARWPEAVRSSVSPGWMVFISTAVAPWTVVICRDNGQCVCRNMINISERCVVYNFQTV